MLALFAASSLGAGCISVHSPLKASEPFFFFLCVWLWSSLPPPLSQPLGSSLTTFHFPFLLLTHPRAFSEGFPAPPPCWELFLQPRPQLCWSSSSTNHLIPDSSTAVRTVPQRSCESPSSAVRSACRKLWSRQPPETSALPLHAFGRYYGLKVKEFFKITLSYSFLSLNTPAYLLRLHLKELCYFSRNYPQVC